MEDDKTLKMVYKADVALRKPIAIISLPDVLDSGSKLLEEIGREHGTKIYEFISYDLPPVAFVKEGKIRLPSIRVWLIREKKRDYLLIVGDDQAMTANGIFHLSDKIAEFLVSIGVEEIIALGTALESENNKIGTISIAGDSEQKAFPTLKEGEILGANGLIPLLVSGMKKIATTVIVFHTIEVPDNSIKTIAKKQYSLALRELFGFSWVPCEPDQKKPAPQVVKGYIY